MAEILRFVLVDVDNNEGDTEYPTLEEAMAAADGTQAVIMRTYIIDDSELVYTPDGGHVWPPDKRAAESFARARAEADGESLDNLEAAADILGRS